jgi:hydroxymethylbilane synthase
MLPLHRPLRLATRASPLALWQARHTAALLRRAWPGLRIDVVRIRSSGDADQTTPLAAFGSVGVFAKEVREALRDGRADLAVHSLKDLPTQGETDLVLPACLRRHDPRDALVGCRWADLPQGARIATASPRRRAQLAAVRPDLRFCEIRGNVETRIRRIREGLADATLLAMAGLQRLGLARSVDADPLDPWAVCTPAPGQGVIGLECRANDTRTRRLAAALDHQPSRRAAGLERAILAGTGGGCAQALGAFAVPLEDGRWRLCLRSWVGAQPVALTCVGPWAGLAERGLAQLR